MIIFWSALAAASNGQWFGDSGVMKRGPFVVADRGVGPLITRRGNLVLYVVDSGKHSDISV